MKRICMSKLEAWKTSKKRKPLILKGVRQAGKTYLLEEFGRTAFKRHHRLNFERQSSIHKIFDGDLNPRRIIDGLQFALQTRIDIEHDLLIFDEIQACPAALTSLKYFCEDLPQLTLCCAGSLLGLHLNEGSFPVGKVDMLHLYPMTFGEFINGIGDDIAADYFHQITAESEITDTAHQYLWERLKHYFITGGLPEVVTTFANNKETLFNAFIQVRQKQRELMQQTLVTLEYTSAICHNIFFKNMSWCH